MKLLMITGTGYDDLEVYYAYYAIIFSTLQCSETPKY